jgi:hypothetical protein
MNTPRTILTVVSVLGLLSGCGGGDAKVPPLPLPQGNQGQSNPNQSILQRTQIEIVRAGLPEDRKCRIRFAVDGSQGLAGYAVFSGKRVVHPGLYDSLFNAIEMQRHAVYSGLCSEVGTGTCDLEFGMRGSVERRYLPTVDGYPIVPRTMYYLQEAAGMKDFLESADICIQRVSPNCQAIYDERNFGYVVLRDGRPVEDALRSLNQTQPLLRQLRSEGYCAR